MAKKGFLAAGFDSPDVVQLIRRNDLSRWALCVGAGTSLPLFPSWESLVKRLIALDSTVEDAQALAASLNDRFSPDALIQAAADRLGYTEEAFSNTIIEELYRGVKTRLQPDEWLLFTKCLAAERPARLYKYQWRDFLTLAEEKFSDVSALAIAKVIAGLIDTDFAPASILSFNAEPLLYALINAAVSVRFAQSYDLQSAQGEQRQYLDIVTRAISNRSPQRIPYIFCHGLLGVPGHQGNSSVAAPDNLVFSESSYLQLANVSYSWQSSSFLDVCGASSMVFIGVSMSDPNMRRWLSWLHATRMHDLGERLSNVQSSTRHYWIHKAPNSEVERHWIESAVAHLGVRLVWIKNWSGVGEALGQILGSTDRISLTLLEDTQ